MTQNLYRQEALDHQNRRLFGEVVLRSPPKVWWVLFLLVALFVIGAALLFAVDVQTSDGPARLIDWLLNRSSG